MQNQDIREEAKKNGVRFWQIAEYLNISEPTMTRKLRHELSKEEKDKFRTIIKQLTKVGV